MSWEELVEEMIAKEERVLGQQATEIAREVEGLDLNGERVVGVDDGPRVAESLLDEYVDALGQPAASALRIQAQDYQDELDLPDALRMG